MTNVKSILHLTLTKAPFLLILQGKKKEEYREAKDYWIKRLTNGGDPHNGYDFKHFDLV